MCLGVPGKVVEKCELTGDLAWGLVEFAGVRRCVCLACTPDADQGDYVIVHAGMAISRIDPVEAEEVFRLLREMGQNEGWDDSPETTP